MDRRRFVGCATAAGLSLGTAPAVLRSFAQTQKPAAAPNDIYALVDPELVPLLKALRQTDMGKLLSPPVLPAPAPQITEKRIPRAAGAPEVTILLLNAAPQGHKRPAFLHMHGGGFVAGTAAGDSRFLQTLAQQCGCVVVSVDYRLAPKTPFPGAIEDCYAALLWLYHNAESLGVDRNRIAVGGESAGGYYAAQLAIYARDRGEVPVLFQMLQYPALDDRTGSLQPDSPYTGQFIWTAEGNRLIWKALLGVPGGSDKAPSGASPARIANLHGLPPAFIGVGSIDLFAGECADYARRLIDAGVSTEFYVAPGAYHGFDRLVPSAAVSRQFTQLWTAALQRAFTRSESPGGNGA
ncbi:MAG TPA: alpha/beta hydrolase [Acidobacteriaceae bacterium]|jgi:acetyl esterase/lipase